MKNILQKTTGILSGIVGNLVNIKTKTNDLLTAIDYAELSNKIAALSAIVSQSEITEIIEENNSQSNIKYVIAVSGNNTYHDADGNYYKIETPTEIASHINSNCPIYSNGNWFICNSTVTDGWCIIDSITSNSPRKAAFASLTTDYDDIPYSTIMPNTFIDYVDNNTIISVLPIINNNIINSLEFIIKVDDIPVYAYMQKVDGYHNTYYEYGDFGETCKLYYLPYFNGTQKAAHYLNTTHKWSIFTINNDTEQLHAYCDDQDFTTGTWYLESNKEIYVGDSIGGTNKFTIQTSSY